MKQTSQNGIWHSGQTKALFTFNKLMMTLLFVASVTACNKEEFYQKDYLDNPYSDDTEVTGGSNGGDTSGTDGSSQGGESSGVTSGTTDGTTGGSSTGTTAGGSTTSGSTTGGSTTGDSTSGGSSTGGSTSGDSTSGGSSTGGSTTGDSTSGGSSTGGSTSGDSTSGGSSTGGSTTGSTSGGTTTGGSSTGGSTTGSTSGGTTGGIGDCNNGHGNDDDGVDDSNPGQGNGGPNGQKDPNASEVCYVNAEEKFQQTAEQTKKIDIIWVIDNSGSMADEQRALGENFDSFIKGFLSKNVDFKMAITTTDTSTSAKKGAIVPGSDVALTSAAAANDEQKFYDDFMAMVKVGTRGSGNEKGLEATEGFISKYSSWIRPEAYLAVVVLSDEEDQSPKSVEFYTENLKGQKSQDGLVKIYSIVNTTNANTGGNTIGHIRYKEASERTAGTVSNIMDRFDSVLLEMGDQILNLLDSFALAAEPVSGSLKVYVNGVESSAYSYDSASRSIKFNAGNLPPVGAQVTVKYKKLK